MLIVSNISYRTWCGLWMPGCNRPKVTGFTAFIIASIKNCIHRISSLVVIAQSDKAIANCIAAQLVCRFMASWKQLGMCNLIAWMRCSWAKDSQAPSTFDAYTCLHTENSICQLPCILIICTSKILILFEGPSG